MESRANFFLEYSYQIQQVNRIFVKIPVDVKKTTFTIYPLYAKIAISCSLNCLQSKPLAESEREREWNIKDWPDMPEWKIFYANESFQLQRGKWGWENSFYIDTKRHWRRNTESCEALVKKFNVEGREKYMHTCLIICKNWSRNWLAFQSVMNLKIMLFIWGKNFIGATYQ